MEVTADDSKRDLRITTPRIKSARGITPITSQCGQCFLGNLLRTPSKFGNSGHTKILGAPKDVLERLTIHPEQDVKPLVTEIKTNLEKAPISYVYLGERNEGFATAPLPSVAEGAILESWFDKKSTECLL